MAPQSGEILEIRHILHSRVDSIDSTSSSESIRSFASSSTLHSPRLHLGEEEEDEEKYLELSTGLEEQGHIFTTTQPLTHTYSQPWRQTIITPSALTTLAHQALLSLALPLLPSFLFRSCSRRKLHPTSHLDGLRGIAALIVFLDHFTLNWYYTLRNGYLSTPIDNSTFQLPIIRLIFAGRASVGVFFAISGFVLSYKPLKQIRANDKAGMLDTLASSVFRRGVRLYIPILFGTLLSAYLAQKGYFTPVPARTEILPPILPTMSHQLYHWYRAIQALIMAGLAPDPNRPYAPSYNGHLWTIPVEFFGSMAVFLAVLATAKARSGARMCVLSALAGWTLRCARWDVGLFIGGAVIAELSLTASASPAQFDEEELPTHHTAYSDETYALPLPSPGAPVFSYFSYFSTKLMHLFSQLLSSLSAFATTFSIVLLVLALYLLSYAGESPSPGIYHTIISPYAPTIYSTFYLGPEHFFLSLGSLLLLFTLTIPLSTNSSSLSLLRALQKPFLSPLAQYLGDISYSLYIVHGLVLFTLGTGLQERWTGQVGEEKWINNGFGELVEAVVRLELDEDLYWRAFWLAGIANAVAVFWAADLFWRGVDGRAVRLGKWVEGLFIGRT